MENGIALQFHGIAGPTGLWDTRWDGRGCTIPGLRAVPGKLLGGGQLEIGFLKIPKHFTVRQTVILIVAL